MFFDLVIIIIFIIGIYLLISKYKYQEMIYTDGLNKLIVSDMNLPNKTNYNRKIQAIIISVDYSDFLRWTLPYNKKHFDHTIVITTPEDIETQKICEYWGVHCVKTNDFYLKDAKFNKANGINYGLSLINKDSWVVHMDADIYLPPMTRDILQMLPLDDQSLYSIDRINCKSFTEWITYLENPESQHGMDGLVKYDRFENGSRLVNLNRDGYIPMGYFQLWHPNASGVVKYPNVHSSADRTDILFGYNFKRENRHLIPDLVCIHLDTAEGEMGQNWNGRTTKRFGLT